MRTRGFTPAESWGWRLWQQALEDYDYRSECEYREWSRVKAIWLATDGSLVTAEFEGNILSTHKNCPPFTPGGPSGKVVTASVNDLGLPDYRYRQCAGQDAGKPQGPVRHKFNHYPATPVGEPGTFLREALSALHRSGADKFQGNSQIARRSRRQELAQQRVDAERRPALVRLSELTRARTKAKERAEDSINGLGDLIAWIVFGCVYAFGWGIASGLLTLIVYWMGRSDGHSDGGPLMGWLIIVSLVGYIPALAWPWISRARARTRLKELNVKIEQEEQQLPKPRYHDPRYVWSDAADDWVRPSGTATAPPNTKQSAPVPSKRTSPSPAPSPVSGMAPTAGELRSPSMAWVVESHLAICAGRSKS